MSADPELQQMIGYLCEEATEIEKRFRLHPDGAREFLEVCEGTSLRVCVRHEESGRVVPLRECPDHVVSEMAIMTFRKFRQAVTH